MRAHHPAQRLGVTWTGREPSWVIEALRGAGLQFDPDRGTGIVLHMLSCLAIDRRFGATAIGMTAEHRTSCST